MPGVHVFPLVVPAFAAGAGAGDGDGVGFETAVTSVVGVGGDGAAATGGTTTFSLTGRLGAGVVVDDGDAGERAGLTSALICCGGLTAAGLGVTGVVVGTVVLVAGLGDGAGAGAGDPPPDEEEPPEQIPSVLGLGNTMPADGLLLQVLPSQRAPLLTGRLIGGLRMIVWSWRAPKVSSQSI